ncbi:MAG TPA: radical SAM protein [Candidatus Saccharimonadales bacterium]|nr:radical SAM protein [Candidatus Saccharimonadales bacterium]
MTDETDWNSTGWLKARDGAQVLLHSRGAEAARKVFGRRVFLRAVLEVSNYCRENCEYCGMRRENAALTRFRAHADQLTELVVQHRPRAVTDLNIQTGEDPVAVREVVLPLIKALRRETNLGISVCLGTLSSSLYQELQQAGATIYIMKFETADAELYRRLQAPGRCEERLEHIRLLADQGWDVSSGFIAGLPGQTEEQLLANFRLARRLPLSGCSVSPFIPGEDTPLAEASTGGIELTLNCMSLLRLMRPDWVIPAVSALNLAGPGSGYQRGLATGANLVTVNLTPSEIRGDYVLYKRDRFIMTEERILSAIEAQGLSPSRQSLADYYQARRQARLSREAVPAVAAG